MRESPYRVSCTFEALAKQKKNASAQGNLKFEEVSNSFWEGTRREKTCLKKVNYLLTSSVRPKHVLLLVVVLCFLQVFRSSYIGKKKGVDFSCAISFWLYSFWVKTW